MIVRDKVRWLTLRGGGYQRDGMSVHGYGKMFLSKPQTSRHSRVYIIPILLTNTYLRTPVGISYVVMSCRSHQGSHFLPHVEAAASPSNSAENGDISDKENRGIIAQNRHKTYLSHSEGVKFIDVLFSVAELTESFLVPADAILGDPHQSAVAMHPRQWANRRNGCRLIMS